MDMIPGLLGVTALGGNAGSVPLSAADNQDYPTLDEQTPPNVAGEREILISRGRQNRVGEVAIASMTRYEAHEEGVSKGTQDSTALSST